MTSNGRALERASYLDDYGTMKIKDAIPALAALAQENRLEVFRLLVQAGADGIPAGQIAGRLKIASPTLSFHLAQLRHAGLIEVRRDGRSLIYAADYDHMNALIGFLMENCCAGDSARNAPACDLQAAASIQARKGKGARL